MAKSGVIKAPELVVNLRPGVTKSFSLDVGLSDDQPVSRFTPEIIPKPDGLQVSLNYALGSNIVSVEVSRCLRETSLSNIKTFTLNYVFLPLQMTARADHCLQTVSGSGQLQNRTGPWSLYFKPQGSSPNVKLDISVGCK